MAMFEQDFPLEVPDLADLLAQEAATAAWLKAHGCTDLRCYADSAANGARHADEDTGAPVVERLPLSTPVMLRNGTTGVITAQSTCDAQRYQVGFFDRHFWQVRQRWYDRGCFEVCELVHTGTAASATVETAALTA